MARWFKEMGRLMALSVWLPTVLLTAVAAPQVVVAQDAADKVWTGEPIQVQKRQDIHVVYDLKVDEWTAGIGRGLYYVRGLLEAYKSQGVAMDQLHISVVLHGKPVGWLLSEDAWQERSEDPFANNPNEHVIEGLLEHGVSIEACNVTMEAMGVSAEQLLPGVKVVHDAYTRLIDLQQRGYAYIRF